MADLLPKHDECEDNLPELPPRRRRPWWKIGCGGLLAILLVVLVSWLVWRGVKLSAIAKLEAEIRALGEPVNAEELQEYYAASASGEDKTAIFVALTPQINDEAFLNQQTDLPYVGEGYLEIPTDPDEPFETEAAVRQFLTEHADLMQTIEYAALAEGDVRFPHDFGKGYGILLPNVHAMFRIAKLLNLQTCFAGHEGDTDIAFRSILALFRCSDALDHEPIIVAQFVRHSIRNRAQFTICDLLPVADFSDDQLRRLIAECGNTDWRQVAKDTFVGERALGRVTFTNPESVKEIVEETFDGYPLVTNVDDERLWLELMTENVQATDAKFPEMIAELKRLDASFEEYTYVDRITHPVSSILRPTMTRLAQSCARAEVQDRATITQLAIELYRRKHGQPPAAITDLVPEFMSAVPIDTLTGQPLKYRLDTKEIVVYSVGQNLVDDGGVLYIEGGILKDGILLDHIMSVSRN